MPLPSPNLDDRDFYQLLEEARQQIQQTCPAWSDLSPGDPGWTLVELFAHLTETMIYRLNRLPEKAYIEFLKLMGVHLNPPTAARVELHFTRSAPSAAEVTIPRGTRVTMGRPSNPGQSAPPIFVTAKTVKLPAGQTAVTVTAYHADWVAAELVGEGTGLPGLSVFAQRPPLVATGGAGREPGLIVGVEATDSEMRDAIAQSERVPALQHAGTAYRLWREVETFANLGEDRHCYQVDRVTGQISFAPAIQLTPAARAQAPAADRAIRLWYYRGGGPTGNVAAHSLTVLKDPIPGLAVTNPAAATGGSAAESLEAALIRGPLELHALDRAVTASDFELHALKSSGAVSRAKALTQADLWQHGTPGTVEVLLVPKSSDNAPFTAAQYQDQETEDTRQYIWQSLEERRPLGTRCSVNWARYKTVQVKARLVVHPGEAAEAVERRVKQKLQQTISPQVWDFGQPLRVDRIYGMVLSEPGVSHVEHIRFQVDEVPNADVQVLAADVSQPRTWYGGAGATLFRSLNDGDSWEAVKHFAPEGVKRVKSHPLRPGLIAVITHLPEAAGSRVYFSFDCGETWQSAGQLSFIVHDIAWISRAGNTSNLLMATSKGLYAQLARIPANPVQLSVDENNADLGFYAVAVSTDARGTLTVAVAAEEGQGIYLSHQEGRSGSFRRKGLDARDIRTLAIQQDGPRTFLWAGAYVAGNETGQGCFRWELPESAEGWVPFDQGWVGGSCRGLVCEASRVYAATFSAGVLTLDASRSSEVWRAPAVSCGLPIRDTERTFYPVSALALKVESGAESGVGNDAETVLLAGGEMGAHRSRALLVAESGQLAQRYESVSETEFTEKVMIPPTWLFCSGTHEVEVISS